jgi:hypothetical protein
VGLQRETLRVSVLRILGRVEVEDACLRRRIGIEFVFGMTLHRVGVHRHPTV